MLVSEFMVRVPHPENVLLVRMRADRLPFLRSFANVPTVASLNVQTTPLFVVRPEA